MKAQPTLFDRCFKDGDGNLALGTAPNLPIILTALCAVLACVPVSFIRELCLILAFGSFFVWSWLELFEGVNYFRRALGLASMVLLVGLVMASDITQL